MRLLVKPSVLFAIVPLVAAGCASATRDSGDRDEAKFTSASATLDDLEFDGELTTADGDPQQAIKDQMLFTIGQLNGDVGVGRLDKISVSNIATEARGD